ncbi:MAG: substrate-binding domain-containing protein [Eubacteriales bacterium]|nr:substrate-binding domain-containing protein [Eubacteriales bacterium]
MKKQMISLIMAGMMCQALGGAVYAEEAELPKMAYEDFPKMDGSLACVPLMEALGRKVTDCSENEAESLLDDFSNTNPCYLALAEGNRDFCIAYEPAGETVEKLKEYAPLTMNPVGKDALVFIVNEGNPVDTLTTAQVHDIFTGKITNWKEVGGEDAKIQVFTRPEKSGSQTLMRKLLIGEEAMTEANTKEVSTMEGMITEFLDYDNSAAAIGYSVYYYASEMMGVSGMKFVSVEETAPTKETIADGSYPLVNDFYFVTREDSPDSAKNIGNWLLSSEGQDFVEECGYVPVEKK